jgi:glycosyltransferase involved in cell wall biosynthesis
VIARLTKARLVYNPHELETERNGLSGISRRICQRLELFFIRRPASCVFVNRSIADWYRSSYGTRLRGTTHVVYNYPSKRAISRTSSSHFKLRETAGLKETDTLFLTQGLLTRGRGLSLLLDAFRKVPKNRHLFIVGSGPLEAQVRAACANSPNIHWHPMVPSDSVLEMTAGADFGLALIEPICLSYRFATPNKLFEYISAGVPVIASRLPAMSEILKDGGMGWLVDPNVESIASLVASLDRTYSTLAKQRAGNAKDRFVWESQEGELFASYGSASVEASL